MSRRSRLVLRKKLRLVLGVAIIFIVLGVGNLFIGRYRAGLYQSLFQQATMNQPSDEVLSTGDASNLERLKARLDFYRIVELGGKCFLVISGFLLLWYLLLLRDEEDQLKASIQPD